MPAFASMTKDKRMNLADEIIYNRPTNVERLLKRGADVNEIDDYGFTPLIEAAIANNENMAELLITHGAKVNEPDVTGGTALHWGVENNNLSLCRLLLKQGANPNAYTNYGQPILVKPLLRRQQDLKELLYQHGANLTFARDYINTKLMGHRFELLGRVDILNSAGKFIEIDFEGFILEFTLNIILDSLLHFTNNFAARNLRNHFHTMQQVIDAFATAAELVKYQQYMVKITEHKERINALLNQELLLLPIGSQGHAVTFIKFGNFLAKCDRGENSLHEPSVIIYKVRNQKAFTTEFFKFLLYQKHDKDFVNSEIKQMLSLEAIANIPLSSQISGNCSWANIEAAIPTIIFMLLLKERKQPRGQELQDFVIAVLNQWREWDKDRALHESVENFYCATPARKASIAAVLAAVLFQKCRFDVPEDFPKINKIVAVLSSSKEYNYILEGYRKIYTEEFKTIAGKNLLEILDIAGQ